MHHFVEESEFAKSDDGENDGALLLLCLFCFSTIIGRSLRAFYRARKEIRREIKTHLSFLISRSKTCAVFGNEGYHRSGESGGRRRGGDDVRCARFRAIVVCLYDAIGRSCE